MTSEWDKTLAREIAKGIIETGVEGSYDSVAKSTAYDYPSIGVSQWEGERANNLLRMITGGTRFVNRTYIDIKASGELPFLKAILDSYEGRAAQLDLLASDCLTYVRALKEVPSLDDTRCFIYAGMWCPTSTSVVKRFLIRNATNYNLRNLETIRNIFRDHYWIAADVGEVYRLGYANRAENTFQYVAGIDLTTPYGIAPYNG